MNIRLSFYTLKKLFVPGLFLSLIFYCTACGTNTLADAWLPPDTVESNIVVNNSTSIAVDKKGKPYICYSDISNYYLTYATQDSFGTWTATPILRHSKTIGASIAVDTKKKNKLHVCYIDDDHNLYYTTNAYNGGWSTAALDISGFPGVDTAIAVDANDKIHICYYNYLDRTLKYTTNVSDTWTTEDVETIDYLVNAAGCSIAVGTFTPTSTTSTSTTTLPSTTTSTSTTSITTNTVILPSTTTTTLYSHDNTNTNSLIYSTDTVTYTPVHISYIGSVTFGTDTASTATPVTKGEYKPRMETRLKHATNASGGWIKTIVHPNDSARPGASIASDKKGNPYMSYSTVDKIMYGIYKDGLWFIEPVDSGNFAWKTSIGIDTLGNAHICYYDSKNAQLMYATNAHGSWKSSVVANVGDGGKYNSLAVAPKKVHISYYDASTKSVKHAAKCIEVSLTASPPDPPLNLTNNKTGTITVTLGCPIEPEGEKITATVNKAGNAFVSLGTSKSARTDSNGNAEFTISAIKAGTATVTFKHHKIKAKTIVTVE